jgi:adenylate cyclase
MEARLTGMTELELLHGFCHRLVAGGVPVGRVNIVIGTLHPIHE